MKIAIFGAGAVGGHIAARLMQSGTPVSVVARGPQLDAIRKDGLRLIVDDARYLTRPQASDRPEDLGPQDIVVLAVKGTGLASAAIALAPLLTPDTRVVFAMNGLPFWFADGMAVRDDGGVQRLLDPDGTLRRALPLDRAAACVISSGGRIVAPGVIENTTPDMNSMAFGFSDGRDDPVLADFAAAAQRAGYATKLSRAIREDVWLKLYLNATITMIAALLGRSTGDTVGDPVVRPICEAALAEMVAVGGAIGLKGDLDSSAYMGRLGKARHRPSVLQDLDAGRPLELDNIILVVVELARLAGVPVPHIATIAALIKARSDDNAARQSR